MFVIGRPAEKIGYKLDTGGIVPRHIQDMMSLIVNLGNAASHSFNPSLPTILSDKEIQKFDNHLKTIGANSKLLIFIFALQFCEILQWMNNYIKNHPDKEENRKKWVLLDKPDNNQTEINEDVGIVEIHDGIYHIGDRYLVNKKTIEERGWLGKKVKVIEKDENTNPYFNQYPYYACRVVLVK